MTEREILSGKFIFVSYTHSDIELVKKDVERLQQDGCRIWYDTNMEVGDNWKSVAESKIKHPNCVAMLSYVSHKSLASTAVQNEQKWLRERKEQDPNFIHFFVVINNKPIDNLFISAEAIYEEKHGVGSYAEIEKEQRKLFNPEIIYIRDTGEEKRQEEIYDKALKLKAVNNEFAIVNDGYGTFTLGSFIGRQTDAFPAENKENGKYTYGNNEYIVLNGVAYTTTPLKWTIIRKNNDGSYVFLCNTIVGRKSFNEVNKFLIGEFKNLVFNKEELTVIVGEGIKLLDNEDVKALGEKVERVLRTSNPLDHWWLNIDGVLEGWKKTCLNGIVYETGFPPHLEKGVRPAIIIDAEKLKKVVSK